MKVTANQCQRDFLKNVFHSFFLVLPWVKHQDFNGVQRKYLCSVVNFRENLQLQLKTDIFEEDQCVK